MIKNKEKLYDYGRNENKYNPKDYLPHETYERLTDRMVQKI